MTVPPFEWTSVSSRLRISEFVRRGTVHWWFAGLNVVSAGTLEEISVVPGGSKSCTTMLLLLFGPKFFN